MLHVVPALASGERGESEHQHGAAGDGPLHAAPSGTQPGGDPVAATPEQREERDPDDGADGDRTELEPARGVEQRSAPPRLRPAGAVAARTVSRTAPTAAARVSPAGNSESPEARRAPRGTCCKSASTAGITSGQAIPSYLDVMKRGDLTLASAKARSHLVLHRGRAAPASAYVVCSSVMFAARSARARNGLWTPCDLSPFAESAFAEEVHVELRTLAPRVTTRGAGQFGRMIALDDGEVARRQSVPRRSCHSRSSRSRSDRPGRRCPT